MFLANLTPRRSFSTAESILPEIRAICAANVDLATFHDLGKSEEGRPIYGVELGCGAQTVSLLAGAHSDEPVGPETLRTLILQSLRHREQFADLFARFTFVIVPHVNPDGEARNQAWISEWPDIAAYLRHAFRELPGRDVEFGYPEMRIENRLVSDFLRKHAPFVMHASLHGMGFSDGLLHLIEKHWIDRTAQVRDEITAIAAKLNLRLHDHDRGGDKGFQYIGPGFTTTPEGGAMRAYFESLKDLETAGKFHDSSMEFVRTLGGDPFCFVTELPLFVINKSVAAPKPGVPQAYLEFKQALPAIKLKAARGQSLKQEIADFEIRAFELEKQIETQLLIIEKALHCVSSRG